MRLTGFLTQRGAVGDVGAVGMSVRDLSLRTDNIYALVGGSGSGKSLFLSLLAGFPLFAWRRTSFWSHWKIFNAEVFPRRAGEPIPSPAFPIDSHNALIYLPQTFPNDRSEGLRTIDAMAFLLCAGCSGLSLATASRRLREVVGSEPFCLDPAVFDQPLHQLSGGERRRVELATRMESVKIRSQDHRRRGDSKILLLLDEPTAGLDPVKELEFIDFLSSLRRTSREAGLGMTIVVATHAFSLITQSSSYFDEVLILTKDRAQHRGSNFIRLVFQGSITEVFQHFERIRNTTGAVNDWTDILRRFNEGSAILWEDAFFGEMTK